MTIVPLLAKCNFVTKNANAAQLLYRIFYWMPKAKITHKGRKWIANSATQWCEQTGLTHDQYRRSIALLRKLELVETEQHLFARKNITHVRTTARADKIQSGAHPRSDAAAPPDACDTAAPELSKNAQLLLQGVSYLESLQGETTVAFASAHAGFGDHKKANTGKQINNHKFKKVDPSVGSTSTHTQKTIPDASNYENGPLVFPGTKKPSDNGVGSSASKKNSGTPEQLSKIWDTIVGDIHGTDVPQWTSKRLKQLAEFRDLCSPGKAHAVLSTCLERWDDFTDHAKLFYAAWSIPVRPTLVFLTKYIDAATDFAAKSTANEMPALFGKEGGPEQFQIDVPSAPVCKPKVDYAEHFYAGFKQSKASIAEVHSILEEDD